MTEILRPKLYLEQIIILLESLIDWLGCSPPSLLQSSNRDELTAWLEDHVKGLGYPDRLVSSVELNVEEVLDMLEEEPWSSVLRPSMLLGEGRSCPLGGRFSPAR